MTWHIRHAPLPGVGPLVVFAILGFAGVSLVSAEDLRKQSNTAFSTLFCSPDGPGKSWVISVYQHNGQATFEPGGLPSNVIGNVFSGAWNGGALTLDGTRYSFLSDTGVEGGTCEDITDQINQHIAALSPVGRRAALDVDMKKAVVPEWRDRLASTEFGEFQPLTQGMTPAELARNELLLEVYDVAEGRFAPSAARSAHEKTVKTTTTAVVRSSALAADLTLTEGERDLLQAAISNCWNLSAVPTEAQNTVITVHVSLSEDAKPDFTSIRMTNFTGGSQSSADIMLAAAQSAIFRCGHDGYPLPFDKYDQWKDLELVFDPRVVLR